MKFQDPTNCDLWNKEILTKDDLRDVFEPVRTIMQESHDRQYVLKCKECGQLYFCEFHEEIDWVTGDDPQYVTYIPVQSEDDIKVLSNTSHLSILEYSPRLQSDWLADGTETVRWIGK